MPDKIILTNPVNSNNNGDSIEVEFQIANKTYNIYFKSLSDTILTRNTEAFIAASILPCMKTGSGQLSAEGEISQKFISSLSTIQDIYCTWYPSLHRTKIKNVIPVPTLSSTENRVGTFFTGGVDSFYTLLKHQDEITDLIFVHGFDAQLNDTVLREEISKKIHEIAAEFGKNVIEIETNLRKLLDPYVYWGQLGHGAALAAIGHLLAPAFGRIYIPATFTYENSFPQGSHPALDPLWSTESLEFIHDGCESTRVEKVALLSKYEIALQSLRACYKNPNSVYNCGRCEKCLRTMINLKINNALNRCTTFETDLDTKLIMNIPMKNKGTYAFFKENLDALNKYPGNDDLKKALQHMLGKPMSHEKKKKHSGQKVRFKKWIRNILNISNYNKVD